MGTNGLPTLDVHRQMNLVWDGMCAYLEEKMSEGKSVSLPHFGSFNFEPIVTGGGNMKNAGGHHLRLRPCFIVGDELKVTLYKYAGKEETTMQPGSIYQQGTKTQFLNPVPIAAGTYYKPNVVKGCIDALFRGLIDLSQRGYNLELDFHFAKVSIRNRDLKVFFTRNFVIKVQDNVASWPERTCKDNIAKTWQSKSLSKALMNFSARPNSPDVQRARTRTLQLGIVSLDLTSFNPGAMSRSASAPAL